MSDSSVVARMLDMLRANLAAHFEGAPLPAPVA